jgi:hypothetical protein
MRKLICSIVLGLLAAPAAAQPGATPVGPEPEPEPYPQPEPAPPYQPMPAAAQPMPPQPPPPGGTRATFVSAGEARWDVRIDNNAVCSTPCSLDISPMSYISLYTQERTPARLDVGHLPAGEVLVQAKPRSQGAFATGVTFTSLSGMGLVTGITLTAVGCATDKGGMCTAGLITGGVSAVGLYLSINLLRSSLPRVYVGPARAAPYAGGNTVGLAGTF